MSKVIGERVRKAREEKGWSQERLAEAVGFKTQGSISMLEKGERNVTGDLLLAISNALRVDPAWLLTGRGTSEGAISVEYGNQELTSQYVNADYLTRRLVRLALEGKIPKDLIEQLLNTLDT